MSHRVNFKKGTTITWTGSELGSCTAEEFDIHDNLIEFRVKSTSQDDFCPKTLTITMNNGYQYKSDEMDDWVDKGKGDHLRSSKRTSGM